MKRILPLLIAVAIAASFSPAQNGWVVDKAHSSVTFTVSHMVISEVSGRFKDFDIALNSSKSDFSDARVESIIKVASINTDNDGRDGHLKSNDFFYADMYPEIRFKSISFEKVAGNKFKITGDLTIRGVTQRVVFDAAFSGSMKSMGKTVAAWKATTVVNRLDYNLKWNKVIEGGGLVVGKDVTITLNLEIVS